MTALERRIDERFDRMNESFDRMNATCDRIEGRFDEIISFLRQLVLDKEKGPNPAKLETDGGFGEVKSQMVAAPNSWVEETFEEIQEIDRCTVGVDDTKQRSKFLTIPSATESGYQPETAGDVKKISLKFDPVSTEFKSWKQFVGSDSLQGGVDAIDVGYGGGFKIDDRRRFNPGSDHNYFQKPYLIRHFFSKKLFYLGLIFDRGKIVIGHVSNMEFDTGNYVFDRGKGCRTAWVDENQFRVQFPDFGLEDKAVLKEKGIDMNQNINIVKGGRGRLD